MSRHGREIRIPPGAHLTTCPKGHETCFYRDCPVCYAQAHPWNRARLDETIRRQARKSAEKALEKLHRRDA